MWKCVGIACGNRWMRASKSKRVPTKAYDPFYCKNKIDEKVKTTCAKYNGNNKIKCEKVGERKKSQLRIDCKYEQLALREKAIGTTVRADMRTEEHKQKYLQNREMRLPQIRREKIKRQNEKIAKGAKDIKHRLDDAQKKAGKQQHHMQLHLDRINGLLSGRH